MTTPTPQSIPPSPEHEHNWSVREHKDRRYLLDGDYYPAYTVYFCTKCLEIKTVTGGL